MTTNAGNAMTDDDKSIPETKYEYLDHTADVQKESLKGGETLAEAFEQSAVAMFGYMTDINTVAIDHCQDIEVDGDDLESLLYRFLDEFLFQFSVEPNFIARKVKILEFDKENFKIKARGFGETFSLDKHPQGTEVKAITYSAMQVHEKEVFVIIDI